MTKRRGIWDALTNYHEMHSLNARDIILWRASLAAKLLLIIAVLYSFGTGDIFIIFSGITALIFMMLPAIIEQKWDVYLPVELNIFVTVFIFVHFVLGELNNYYDRLPWLDMVLHMSSGMVIALLGFLIITTFIHIHKIKAHPLLIIIFSISLAMGIAAVWEIYEFSMDVLFGFNMQKSGLIDTMWDLIMTLIGAILVSAAGHFYLKAEQKGKFIHQLAKKIVWKNRRKVSRVHQ